MPSLRSIVRYGYAPFMMFGMTDAAYWVVSDLVAARGPTSAYLLLVPLLAFDAPVPAEQIGNYDPDLTEEFFMALTRTGGITLHVRLLSGRNSHHIVEGVFKAVAKALRIAVEIDPRAGDEVPSTKGILS